MPGVLAPTRRVFVCGVGSRLVTGPLLFGVTYDLLQVRGGYAGVMQRMRDTSRHVFMHHASADVFLGEPRSSGAHTVMVKEQPLDLLIQDRSSPVTLVVFHSLLTDHQPTVPVLQGQGMAESCGANLVAVADPSLELGDIDLAWYLGNRWLGPLSEHLAPLIRHALYSLGTERTILFGASGGGFAATMFAPEFPDSIVLAVNPRLDLAARPRAQMETYLRVCHNAQSATPMLRIRKQFVTDNVADFIGDELSFDMLLFQNLGDGVHLRNQANPFVDRYQGDPRLQVRFQEYGDGHLPIPKPVLSEILVGLAAPVSRHAAIQQAGFTAHTPDLMRG